MKKLYVTMLGLAAIAAGLTACHDDDVSSAPNVFEQDEVQYVTVAIGTPSTGTRAETPKDQEDYYGNDEYDGSEDPEYESGISGENDIKSVYLVFYDEDGYRVGQSIDMNEGAYEQATTLYPNNGTSEAETGNINRQRVILKAVTFKKNEKKPKYALAFVNPVLNTESLNSDAFASLRGVEKYTLSSYYSKTENKEGFAMSNSVYYDNEGNRVVATEIEDGVLTASKAAADALYKEITENNASAPSTTYNGETVKALDIYVERYAVKVKFGWGTEAEIGLNELSAGSNTRTYTKEADGTTTITPKTYKLKFIPEAWAVNATESSVYAVKTYFNGNINDPFAEPHSYDGINAVLTEPQGSIWWNSPNNYRSYWAQSPAYYKERYPNVSDDIKEAENGGAHESEEDYPLKYYSYNEITSKAVAYNNESDITAVARKFTTNNETEVDFNSLKGQSTRLYVHENTLGKKALENENPRAAVPAVVVIGHYEVEGEYQDETKTSTDVTTDEFKTFYLINKERIYFGTEEIATRLLGYEEYLFTKQDQNTYIALSKYDAETMSYIKIAHPDHNARQKAAQVQTSTNSPTDDQTALDHKVVDSRYVSLQIDGTKLGTTELYYAIYNAENGEIEYKKIVSGSNANEGEITVDEVNGRVLNFLPPVEMFNEGKAYFYIPITHLRFWVGSTQKYTTDQDASDYDAKKAGQFIMPTSNDYDWTKARVGDFGLVRNHVYNISLDKISGLGTGIPDPDTPIVPPSDEEDYSLVTRINILNWAIVPTQHVEF